MEHLTNITSPWPFSTWGINIIGPLPPSKKQLKFLIVAIDYFTTWVEAEPLAIITEAKIQNFVWKNLVCRFGIPQVIISNRQMARHPQARSWGEGITILHLDIHRQMARQKSQIRLCSNWSKPDLRGQKGHGLTSSQECCGLTERRWGHQLVRHPSRWLLEPKQ